MKNGLAVAAGAVVPRYDAGGGRVIILLNGTSSAGKTSIARELQRLLPEPYLHTGIDHFFRMLPPQYLGTESPADQGFRWVPPPPGTDTGVTIEIGPVGQRMIAGYHRAVAALAAAGNRLIVDDVLLDLVWLRDWVEVLFPFPVLFVGVRCPLLVAERRERERGDRTVGQARGHFATVHAHGDYDVEVDTSLADARAAPIRSSRPWQCRRAHSRACRRSTRTSGGAPASAGARRGGTPPVSQQCLSYLVAMRTAV